MQYDTPSLSFTGSLDSSSTFNPSPPPSPLCIHPGAFFFLLLLIQGLTSGAIDWIKNVADANAGIFYFPLGDFLPCQVMDRTNREGGRGSASTASPASFPILLR